jgi:hypothetical protein
MKYQLVVVRFKIRASSIVTATLVIAPVSIAMRIVRCTMRFVATSASFRRIANLMWMR